MTIVDCPDCSGKGFIGEEFINPETCFTCCGDGKVSKELIGEKE